MYRYTIEGDNIFLLRDFLTPEECQQYIDRTEKEGYGDAPITTASGFVMRKDIRNNDRVIIDDVDLAAELFERAKEELPKRWLDWELVGLNERFRFYRYDVGQFFAPHSDGYFQRDNGERSQFTFMVYLNEGFEGGPTTFPGSRDPHAGTQPLVIRPETGLALVFYHHQLHQGAPVLEGRKYVLRTDVMYRRIRS